MLEVLPQQKVSKQLYYAIYGEMKEKKKENQASQEGGGLSPILQINMYWFLYLIFFYGIEIQFTLFCRKFENVEIYTFLGVTKLLKNHVRVKFVPNSMSDTLHVWNLVVTTQLFWTERSEKIPSWQHLNYLMWMKGLLANHIVRYHRIEMILLVNLFNLFFYLYSIFFLLSP